jgi:hypothetical protein
MITRHRRHDEAGAALQLALIFLTAIAVIIGALLTFASTSSQATIITRTARGTDYDADAAMQAAIATIRVNTCVSYTPPTATLNDPGRPLRVDCSPLTASKVRRRDVLSVCLASVPAPCPASSALLRADVVYYDDQSFGRAVAIKSWSNA